MRSQESDRVESSAWQFPFTTAACPCSAYGRHRGIPSDEGFDRYLRLMVAILLAWLNGHRHRDEGRVRLVNAVRNEISDLETSSSLELWQHTAQSVREGWFRISNIRPRVFADRITDLRRDSGELT